MVSMRFPFSFSQPSSKPPNSTTTPRSISVSAVAVAAAACAGIAAGVSISQTSGNKFLQSAFNFSHSSPPWGSISLAEGESTVTDKKTGVSFPSVLKDCQRLLGIGVRKKSVLGLKNIDVYAFGVYVDEGDVKKFLSEKYGTLSSSALKEKKEVGQDLMESDISITVRLQIVYGKLSIRSVRNAFEESVGNRLQKFGGSDNKELLQRFTSQFSDEYKIPRGSIIDLSRETGHVLRTTIDGKEVGSIQSELLCRSILDLYIGDDPFDRKAKEDVDLNVALIITK